jgi:MoxR-like ATPase
MSSVPRPLRPARSIAAAPEADAEALQRLRASVEAVVHGKSELVLHVLTALLARGHVLVEDVPGVGKTTLAHAVARALGCSFSRIQFTADLLPSDILGVSAWEPQRGEFRFHAGPVFAQVLLADEINRTPPRTQSALLEAMNEGQVTVDGRVQSLPSPFLVMATQNPLEHHGTFPLPESQVDRFLMRLQVGYPDRESERLLLRETAGGRPESLAVLDPDRVLALQARAADVQFHRDLEDYVLALLEATRRHSALALGASPRAGQALVRAARARALLLGRDHVIPDDLLALAEPVLLHRLVAARGADARGASLRPQDALQAILAGVAPPR